MRARRRRTRWSPRPAGPMPAALEALSPGLDPDQLDVGVVEEGGEGADRVRPPTDAGDHRRGSARPRGRRLLAPRHRSPAAGRGPGPVRRRADRRPDHVVRRRDVGDPVADRGADRLLERGAPASTAATSAPSSACARRSAPGGACPRCPCIRRTRGRAGRMRSPPRPCCPAPVSAITRGLPIRFASSAWPTALLILWAPVCRGPHA